jgi:2-hydroxychromene-2-carboxylate isomerase
VRHFLPPIPLSHAIPLSHRPSLFHSPIFTLPDGQHTDKDKWINIERQRWSKLFSIPIADKAPDPFPQSTLGAQRALVAMTLDDSLKGKLSNALDDLYKAFW